MPICPRCNTTIHSGAEEQCPACGYGMERADSVFGSNDVEFTRVVDEAGALTHRERMELLHFLADLERHISPVALCIYITDHGQAQEFRSHAHWILNHTRIHHPSFGKREQMRAIEDAELTERRPGEERQYEEEEEPGWLARNWKDFCNWCRDLCLPTPPPVRQDWIFMLVLDVQLEMACFSWGYMLDPYISADLISSSIVGARLQFRERAMVTALRKVMKSAVNQIAASTRKVNKKLRHSQNRGMYVLPWMLGAAVLAGAEGQAQDAAPAPVEPPVTTAETAAEAQPPQEAPPAPQPPVKPGVAASYSADPQWSSVDYVHLMSGRLPESYNLLIPDGKQREVAPEPAPRRKERQPRRRSRQSEATRADLISDSCCQLYLDTNGAALRNPQLLLSEAERQDVLHVLRELNAHSRFHIYVSVFREGQEVPMKLSATNLLNDGVQPGTYTALLQYTIGNPPGVELAYKEIKPTEEQKRDWLLAVRLSANAAGGGVDGLLAAIRRLYSLIEPLSAEFVTLTPDTSGSVRAIDLPIKQEEVEKETSWKDEAEEWVKSGAVLPYVIFSGVVVAIGALFTWLYFWHRSCGRLFSSEPDVRLGSRYGAGVSRYVKYLEGKESGKEKQLY